MKRATPHAWRLLGLAGLLLLLPACARPVVAPAAAGSQAAADGNPAARSVRSYNVVADESLLTVLVYRGGSLARLGHNHVIASHHLSGQVRIADPIEASTVELMIPAALLTVDEPALRALEGAEFSVDVPDSARDGTRHNMLGPSLLNAVSFPGITIRSTGVSGVAKTASGGWSASSGFSVGILGANRVVSAPVTLERVDDQLVVASAQFALRQTDLGLVPFSVMLGALQVQDELKVRIRLSARAPR